MLESSISSSISRKKYRLFTTGLQAKPQIAAPEAAPDAGLQAWPEDLGEIGRDSTGSSALVGRRGIKIGDRVQISRVTGDVTDIGWLQFRLREIDNETHQPTGRADTFSNSFVFASPATGLSKFNREDLN